MLDDLSTELSGAEDWSGLTNISYDSLSLTGKGLVNSSQQRLNSGCLTPEM